MQEKLPPNAAILVFKFNVYLKIYVILRSLISLKRQEIINLKIHPQLGILPAYLDGNTTPSRREITAIFWFLWFLACSLVSLQFWRLSGSPMTSWNFLIFRQLLNTRKSRSRAFISIFLMSFWSSFLSLFCLFKKTLLSLFAHFNLQIKQNFEESYIHWCTNAFSHVLKFKIHSLLQDHET